MALIDIERIRVSAELEAYEILERKDRGSMLRFNLQKHSDERRALMSRALLLTDTMAPEPYAAARKAMTALGVEDRVELFQSDDAFGGARLMLNRNPIGIEFFGDYLERLDGGALLAVMGHEIGHAIAHGQAKYRWALTTCQKPRTPVRRAYAMAAELTADRFGLLACRDLHAALRLEMQTVAGKIPLATQTGGLRFDTEAYLEQCRAFAEETLNEGAYRLLGTHPEHYLRGYAEWLFWESDVYRELTGEGPGTRKIAEVDAVLRALVGLPLDSAPTKTPKPRRPDAGDFDAERFGDRARATLDAVTDFARRLRGPTAPVVTELATRFQDHIRTKKK